MYVEVALTIDQYHLSELSDTGWLTPNGLNNSGLGQSELWLFVRSVLEDQTNSTSDLGDF